MRICSKILTRYAFSNSKFRLPTQDFDMANTIGLLNASENPSLSFAEKLSIISPSNIYTSMDELSRDLIFGLVDNYQMGLPASVILISFALKGIFFYPSLKSQIMAIKMRQMESITNQFKQKMRIGQMSKNTAMIKQAKKSFKQAQMKNGIDNIYSFYTMLQLPFLITWFLSLRYITTLPEAYPIVQQSFLWMQDISTFDPYFILPLFSASLTSYSLVISPTMNRSVQIPLFAAFTKYIKFLPFLSLPITAFFPALINLYWGTLAISQFTLMACLNSKAVQKRIKVQKKSNNSQISKAMYIQQAEPQPKSQQGEQEKEEREGEVKKKIHREKEAETIKISNQRGKKKREQ